MHGEPHHHPGTSQAEAMDGPNLDAYNFWAVSEGGESIGSDMLEFNDALFDDERWQIILYLATNFEGGTSD